MNKKDIKVVTRYLIVVFFLYLAWDITRPGYINNIKELSEIAASAIYGSVFGVLGWVVKSNWTTDPKE